MKEKKTKATKDQENSRSKRYELLRRFEAFFEIPMIVLGFVWILLLILELVYTTTPLLEKAVVGIWIIFIIDFVVKFILAPVKLHFLKSNVLTLISLVIPAFRVLRVLYVLRFARSLRLVKVLGSLNRGMRALSLTVKRRALGYVIALSILVLFVGAAGMHTFEKNVNEGLSDYGTALWWTGMILTTMGSEYWPKTTEGRILCIFLALYAFAVFGYVTASIATFFIGQDAEDTETEIAGAKQIDELRKEILELKEMIRNK